MTEVWPADVQNRLLGAPTDNIRPPRCLLLMPFDKSFDDIAALVHETTNAVFEQFRDFFALPQVDRLDWVTSSGAIQQQIWQKIVEADLVICDLTGYNPNVMFESGVTAAWKKPNQVIFIKDSTFATPAPFDIMPMRYFEYERSSFAGIKAFQQKLASLIRDAFISFPDGVTAEYRQIPDDYIREFGVDRDDLSIVTAPFAHRRAIDGVLEIGSLWAFPHSWATIGKRQFYEFALECSATFRHPHAEANPYIGIGVRSQHYYANFAHILYLNLDGRIVITEPNEQPPKFYEDIILRGPTSIDPSADHRFAMTFDHNALHVAVDDFRSTFPIAGMKKALGPGLIRFQAYRTWMGLRSVKLKNLIV
jgi:hypothetical protein